MPLGMRVILIPGLFALSAAAVQQMDDRARRMRASPIHKTGKNVVGAGPESLRVAGVLRI